MRVGGRLLLGLIFIALSVSAATHADDAPAWTAWLHYGRHMTLIDSNGQTLREVNLPLPEGYSKLDYRSQFHIAMSANGRFAAYLAEDAQLRKSLMVYDTEQQKIVLDYPIADRVVDNNLWV